MTTAISSGGFDDVRRPVSFRSTICRARASRSYSFSPSLAAAVNPWARRVTESHDRNRGGDRPELISAQELTAARCAAVLTRRAQDRRRQQPAKPGRMLQHRELVPGVKGNDRLQYWRQITDLVEHAAPFLQTLVLVPIKIVDQRIPFPGGPSALAGPASPTGERATSSSYRRRCQRALRPFRRHLRSNS